MDKELLRVVIILIGLLVMIGMVLWHFLKSLRENREEYSEDEAYQDRPYHEGDDEHELDIYPGNDLVDGDGFLDDEAIKPSPRVHEPFDLEPEVVSKTLARDLPHLIEFSLVANAADGFNGELLFDALEKQGLVFGDVQVFERLDTNRMVDFTVASMIKPGTFPEYGLDEFYCPGIVFYMQPRELDKPLAVFDDFMDTLDNLADELDGVILDNQKQPLTVDTVEHFRQLFAHK